MSLDSYLFGSIITISSEQVHAPLCDCGYCTGLDATIYFVLCIFLTFDEDTAHVDGLPVRLMSLLFQYL